MFGCIGTRNILCRIINKQIHNKPFVYWLASPVGYAAEFLDMGLHMLQKFSGANRRLTTIGSNNFDSGDVDQLSRCVHSQERADKADAKNVHQSVCPGILLIPPGD